MDDHASGTPATREAHLTRLEALVSELGGDPAVVREAASMLPHSEDHDGLVTAIEDAAEIAPGDLAAELG